MQPAFAGSNILNMVIEIELLPVTVDAFKAARSGGSVEFNILPLRSNQGIPININPILTGRYHAT